MDLITSTPQLKVLLLFNLDSGWSTREQAEIMEISTQLGEAIGDNGYPTTLLPVKTRNLDAVLSDFNPHEYIIFNWCESLPGIRYSEWLVTEYLEKHGFTFTGSDSATIALSQDKPRMKQLLSDSGIRTPGWRTFDDPEAVEWNIFPAIVKPAREHCSEGIDRNAVVTDAVSLRNRVAFILEEYRQPALVEDFIDGRELHISLWGDGEVKMLPPAEMEFSLFSDAHDRLCTFESKFVPESVSYQNIQTVLPAPLTPEEYRAVEEMCRSAYLAAGCRDYARIDMRMRDGLIYILDVNPNCDISPDTSTIYAAEYAGFSYGEFGKQLVQLAGRRHPIFGDLTAPVEATKIPI